MTFQLKNKISLLLVHFYFFMFQICKSVIFLILIFYHTFKTVKSFKLLKFSVKEVNLQLISFIKDHCTAAKWLCGLQFHQVALSVFEKDSFNIVYADCYTQMVKFFLDIFYVKGILFLYRIGYQILLHMTFSIEDIASLVFMPTYPEH